MKKATDYAAMQKSHYETTSHLGTSNHKVHNKNPDYMGILLKPVFEMKGGFALDFGCGHGRNVQNLLAENIFDRVDGVDISAKNIEYATKNILESGFDDSKFSMMVNNGLDVSVLSTFKIVSLYTEFNSNKCLIGRYKAIKSSLKSGCQVCKKKSNSQSGFASTICFFIESAHLAKST